MYLLHFCTVVLVLSQGVYSRECSDCINYDLCPRAVDLTVHKRNDATVALFREASCGFNNSMKIPKVCCSMFMDAGDERIENHRNLRLLPDDCGHIISNRLIGGNVAEMYEFPWMALVAHENRDGISFKCGGSIINKRYVLTAAHCVKNKIIAGVRIGEYDLRTDIDCQKNVCETHIQDVPVEKSVIHENYQGPPKVFNDIALLRLSQDVDFEHRNVHRVCLPLSDNLRHNNLSREIATVTGWGLTENHTDASVLLKGQFLVHTAEQCSALYNRFLKPGDPEAIEYKLCAGTQDKDSCKGDLGGPLIIEESINGVYKFVQYGIVSHGPQQCGSEYPGVYTDLRKYTQWILDNIEP